MSLIQIIANNIEIDYVKESLSIKTENNALSRDFKVSATSYPFLIIENRKTQLALGTRDLASIKKLKVIDVTVFEGGKKFYGELQILTYLNGFRKCDLKYSSITLSVINKKIGEFMPIVSVIPDELNPIPYLEKMDAAIDGSQYWKTYPLTFLDKNYPEVKWQFPTMKWFNKFGVDLATDSDWYLYKNLINEYNESGLIENKYTIVGEVCTVENRNVPSPQIFLLSPLFYALQSIGFTVSGNFVNSDFIKRLLFYSNKNNLSETHPLKNSSNVVLPTLIEYINNDDEGNFSYSFWMSSLEVPTPYAGTYFFEYDFQEIEFDLETTESGYVPVKTLQFVFESLVEQYIHLSGDPDHRFKGSVKIEVSEEQVGQNIYIRYRTPDYFYPQHTIIKKAVYSKKYFQMHPTIKLGRYLPEWTFGTYLNELQNLFNLEINIDDFTKKMKIDFNEETIVNTEAYVVKKSLLMTSYDPAPFNAFLLKYDNDEDPSLWIKSGSVEDFNLQNSNFLEKLTSKFKNVPVTYTADLSESLDSKGGTGIMIYDPVYKPFISKDFIGQTLEMNGNNGIYNRFWKVWLKFLLNSSAVELSGPFTETEKNKLLELKRMFIDHQEYIISSVICKETQQDNFEIKFSLQSVTF